MHSGTYPSVMAPIVRYPEHAPGEHAAQGVYDDGNYERFEEPPRGRLAAPYSRGVGVRSIAAIGWGTRAATNILFGVQSGLVGLEGGLGGGCCDDHGGPDVIWLSKKDGVGLILRMGRRKYSSIWWWTAPTAICEVART